jgi:hypothetical protein
MSLPLPDLDTRTWADLVAEGVALAPRFAPAWTDQNLHDPGITLLELLAYQYEQAIYRANRVTASLRLRFLRLAGPSAAPPGPRPARLALTFAPRDPSPGPLRLPRGLVLVARPPSPASASPTGPALTHEPPVLAARLLHDLVVHPLSIRAIQASDGRGRVVDVTRLRRDEAAFPAWGEDPVDPGDASADDPPALYLGLDRAPIPGRWLSLRVELDPGPGPAADERDVAESLRREARAARDARGKLRPRAIVREEPPEPAREFRLRRHEDTLPMARPAPAAVAWEYWAGWADRGRGGWRPLEVRDATAGLARDGSVRVRVPRADRFRLRVRGHLASPGELPARGRCEVLVAEVGGRLRVRAFDGDGRMIADLDESSFAPRPLALASLRALLDDSGGASRPTGAWSAAVLGAVAELVPGLASRRAFGEVALDLAYLRCRLASGRPDLSPRIARIEVNAAEVEQSFPAVQVIPPDDPRPGGPRPTLREVAAALLAADREDRSAPVIVPGGTDADRSLAGAVVEVRPVPASPARAGREAGPGGTPPPPLLLPLRRLDPPTARDDGTAAVPLRQSVAGAGLGSDPAGDPASAVVPESLRVVSLEPPGPDDPAVDVGGRGVDWVLRAWEARDDLDGSGPRDAHYVLDPGLGELDFGDGDHGRALPPGSVVLAAFDVTLGAAGNPAPRRRWRVAGVAASDSARSGDPPPDAHAATSLANAATWPGGVVPAAVRGLDVTNADAPAPARAGRDAGSLDDALARLARSVRVHQELADAAAARGGTLDGLPRPTLRAMPVPRQAITPADFERMALDVPGATVLRARAFAGVDPGLPGLAVPAVVTLAIVPGLPRGRPEPGRSLLDRVAAHLRPRTALGTRLAVVGPAYEDLRIAATLRAATADDAPGLARRAEADLRAWFDPLGGWPGPADPSRPPPPFGRAIARAEVLARLSALPGVAEVVELAFGPAPGPAAERPPWSLPSWASIRIDVEGPS